MSREGSHPSKRCPRRSGGSRSGTTLDSLAGLLLTRISTVRTGFLFEGVAKKALVQDLNDIKSAVEQE
jgi:hypothetical protein